MSNEQMTPQQAIAILDQATALAPLNRRDHSNAIQALRLLESMVAPPTEPKEEKESADAEPTAES